jgi:hypothetical protein
MDGRVKPGHDKLGGCREFPDSRNTNGWALAQP